MNNIKDEIITMMIKERLNYKQAIKLLESIIREIKNTQLNPVLSKQNLGKEQMEIIDEAVSRAFDQLRNNNILAK